MRFAKGYLATVSADGGIRLWDLAKLPPRDTFEGRADDFCSAPVAFSPNGQVIATVSSNATDVLSLECSHGTLRGAWRWRRRTCGSLFPRLRQRTWRRSWTLWPSLRTVSLAVARGFQFNLTSTNTLRSSMVELYDAERQVLVDTFPGAWPIQFSPDGARIAMASPNDDGGVLIRELASGVVWTDRENDPPPRRTGVHTLAFSPDGRLLATGGMTRDGDGELALLDAGTGRCLGVLTNGFLQTPPARWPLRPMATSSSAAVLRANLCLGRRPAPGSKGTGRSCGNPSQLAISPDGKTLASGSDAGVLKLWSLEQGVEFAYLARP